MLVLPPAVNRDPEHYPDPDRFDVERPVSDHLASSTGPRLCPAAVLDRYEVAIVLSVFACRVVDPTSIAYRTKREPARDEAPDRKSRWCLV